MGRLSKSAGYFIVMLALAGIMLGSCLMINGIGDAKAASDGAIDDIRLSSARDFLYAYQPQSPEEDSVLVTAHLYKGGQPVKKAGIPVDISLSDGRFATLDDRRVYTDEWGTASTRVRSHDSGQALPEHPFLLAVTASADGKSSQVTLPITRYMTLNGTVRNKGGSPVKMATVVVLYNRTHNPINAMGATTTTDDDGNYRLERVPIDLGDVTVYARKGDMETYMPAGFPEKSK